MARHDAIFQLRGEKSYSQAVVAGNLIFISGTVSWDDDFKVVGEGDMERQIEVIYRDIGRTLAAFNLGPQAIVKETVFTVDMEALVAVNAGRARFYGNAAPPASTWVAIGRLANPRLLLEVEAIAVR